MKRSLAAAAAGIVTVGALVALPTVRMNGTSAAFSDAATSDSLDLSAGEVTLTYDGTPLGSVELGIGLIGPGFNEIYEFSVHNDSTVQNPTDQTEFRLYPTSYDTTGETGPGLANDLTVSIERQVGSGNWELIFDGAFADLDIVGAGWASALGDGGTDIAATSSYGALVTNDNTATANVDEGGTASYRLTVDYPPEAGNAGANGAVEVAFTVEGRSVASITPVEEPMLLTAVTTAGSQSVTLPLYGTVDAQIDWNTAGADPVSCAATRSTAGMVSCTYPSAGTYQIAVTGTVTQFGRGMYSYFNASRLTAVTQWGTLGTTSLAGAFNYATNLTTVPATLPSGVTDLSFMFAGATSFTSDITGWNTSSVTNMDSMFENHLTFNQNISGWNVSNVTSMAYMFSGAEAFNQPIGSWNVSNVTNMAGMFYYATAFNQPIGSWNVSNVTNVTNMESMFAYAEAFNQNLSTWCVAAIPTAPTDFAAGASSWTLAKPNWGSC